MPTARISGTASFRTPPTGPREARPDDRLRGDPESIAPVPAIGRCRLRIPTLASLGRNDRGEAKRPWLRELARYVVEQLIDRDLLRDHLLLDRIIDHPLQCRAVGFDAEAIRIHAPFGAELSRSRAA